MITLFINTALSKLTIGIVKEKEILYEKNLLLARSHSEFATSEIKNAFKSINLELKEIDQIMVVVGPGSFTGIRIGVTIAKTLSFLLNKKIIGVDSLKIRALSQKEFDYCGVVIDARRDNVYGAIYDNKYKEILVPSFLAIEEFNEIYNKLKNKKIITSPNQELLLNDLVKDELDVLKVVEYYQNQEGVNPHLLNPFYLKKTEAEEKRSKNE